MQVFRTALGRLATAAVLGGLLAGCAGVAITGAPDVNRTSFGDKKRYAVVTIASHKEFTGERALFDAFRSADNVAGANSQPIIDKLAPRIVGTLGHSTQFTLLPESRVLGNRAYKAAQEDPRMTKVAMFTSEFNVAQGYRYFSEPQKYGRLAQDLGVDGVIAVQVHFGISSGTAGTSIRGIPLGRKTYSATATAAAVAYNQKGEVVWKDTTTKEADPDDTRAIIMIDSSAFTGADFQRLQPSAVEIGAKAVEVLLARFEDTMAGKSVDRLQFAK